MYQSDLKHSEPRLQEKLEQLYTLNRDKKIDLSFRPPYLNLLEKFGNPHLNLPPVIHVAGTNGKGSIIAMLRSVLETAGYSVHAYTSPHLIKFNERIVLAGQEIENALLEDLIDKALAHNAGGDVTFFEITTAMAFAAFSRTPADICLLEVGMGGRLDCTNIIETPLACVINTIGMDHSEHLGDTITKIASEKAGIMKQGTPCIIGHQNDEIVLPVFENKAEETDCPLFFAEDTPHKTNLKGPHQQKNLSTALKTLEIIAQGFPVQDEHIKSGLQNAKWRARLQKLEAEYFGLNNEWKVFLDGGHNEDAGKALAQEIPTWGKPTHIICGMMKGKNAQAFLEPVVPYSKTLSFVDIEGEPLAQSAQELHTLFAQSRAFTNTKAALEHLKKTEKPGNILICGSLYLAGQVLQEIEKSAHT